MPELVRLLGESPEDERLPFDLRGGLLAYLAYAGGWLPREQVAFLFWPDTDEASARRNLRQLLNRSKALPLVSPLELEPSRLRWPVRSDVSELRRAVGRQQWQEVVDLYRGDLLAGRPQVANPGFGAWLELERENLRNTYRRALSRLAEEHELNEDHASAMHRLEPLLRGDELAEEPLQAYMRNAYLAGQRQLALEAYDRFAKQLQDEMELEPLYETQQLAQLIRRAAPLAGATPRRARKAPLQVQRPPELVGRDAELQAARQAGTPVVLLSGEAGVGKSRLIEELAAGAPGARCLEGLQSVPYQPVVDLVRNALNAGWSPEELGDYAEDLARLVPEAMPGRPAPPGDPLTTKSRLLEALARCLEGAYASGDGVAFHLTFDDLQWADEGTLELLTLLASRGAVRLLGAFRRYEITEPLERALTALRSGSALTLVKLEPLTEAQLRRLLATLMGQDEGPERFARWLHGSSAGNVMFALETLKAMFESGALAADTSGWRSELDAITRDYSELEAPQAISDVILRQLKRLSPEGVRTVQAAAVLGANFSPRLLAAMNDSSQWAEQDALDELERSGLVTAERFRHDLIRQSVYGSVSAGRRKLLHASAAEALDGQRSKTIDTENRIVVGEHLLAAGMPVESARAFGRAAGDMQELGLAGQARTLLEGTLVRFQRRGDDDPPATEPYERAVTGIKVGLSRCLMELGDLAGATSLVEEALEAASTPELQGSALGTRAALHLRSGRLEQASADAERAVEYARQVGNRLLELDSSTIVAESAYHQGDLDRALRIVEANVYALRREDLPLALVAQLASLGAILDGHGQHDEALAAHLESLELARAMGAPHQVVNVALNLVDCYRELGRHGDALSIGEEALALAEVDGTKVLRNNVASLLVELGRLGDAEKYTLQNAELPDPTLSTVAWTRLVTIYSRQGEAEKRRAALSAMLKVAPLTEYPTARVYAATALLDHGEEAHQLAALELVDGLDPEGVPGALKADLTRVLQALDKS